jgi:hypothetical protein
MCPQRTPNYAPRQRPMVRFAISAGVIALTHLGEVYPVWVKTGLKEGDIMNCVTKNITKTSFWFNNNALRFSRPHFRNWPNGFRRNVQKKKSELVFRHNMVKSPSHRAMY